MELAGRASRQRERLVRVAPVAGDLAPEPPRRREALARLARGELDLGDEQPVVRAGVDVELGRQADGERDDVADLVDPAARR